MGVNCYVVARVELDWVEVSFAKDILFPFQPIPGMAIILASDLPVSKVLETWGMEPGLPGSDRLTVVLGDLPIYRGKTAQKVRSIFELGGWARLTSSTR